MSVFLALTRKPSKKSTFLWKGILDPRTHVWTDLKLPKVLWKTSAHGAKGYYISNPFMPVKSTERLVLIFILHSERLKTIL